VTAYRTTSEAETTAIGRTLGRQLGPGDAVLLVGQLGAGKTAFARGLAEGLGSDPDAVSSPTFTIVQEYSGRIRMQHVDLYRLSPEEVDDLALEDLWEDSVLVVEWPDRWRRRPHDAIRVEIEHADGDERTIRIEDRRSPPLNNSDYRDSTR
jgi:tRNA threonylcarbamoyladenosine biosynthesis protein TsaE